MIFEEKKRDGGVRVLGAPEEEMKLRKEKYKEDEGWKIKMR